MLRGLVKFKASLMFDDVVKGLLKSHFNFFFTVSPHHSISLQPGDRMEEQLPSSEGAGQGEKNKHKMHLSDTFTFLSFRWTQTQKCEGIKVVT